MRRCETCVSPLCAGRKCAHLRQVLIDTNTYDKLNSTLLVDDHGDAEKYWDLANDSDPLAHDGKRILLTRRAVDMEPDNDGQPVKRRADYPYLMFLPLAPLVLQERAIEAPCDGFGNAYAALLNKTSFSDTATDPATQCNINYLADVSHCFLREETATTMEVTTWNSSLQQFESHTEHAREFNGRMVFWHFVSHSELLRRANWIDAITI